MARLKHLLQKGQVNMLVAVVGSLGVIISSGVTAWATANNKVNQIDTKVQIVQEREENHYKELQANLQRIEKKLDSLIVNSR